MRARRSFAEGSWWLMVALAVAPVWAAAQTKKTFDLIEYAPPPGWEVAQKEGSVVYNKVDEARSAYAILTVYASIAAEGTPGEVFDRTWKQVVQEATKAGAAEKGAPIQSEGWTVVTGLGQFELDGQPGAAMLVCAVGHGRAVNVVVLTNTDAFESDLNAFFDSVSYLKPSTMPLSPPAATGLTTTTFDDGWISRADPEFVTVQKGELIVRVHYPNPVADAYNSVLAEQTGTAWRTLVEPRYRDIEGFAIRDIQSFESVSFADAVATERATGRRVYVVLFRKKYSSGMGKFIEFMTDSKETFESEFMAYRNDEFGWEKLEAFADRNRFAVSESELKGTWATSGYASLRYYYVSGGGFAGATATSTADEFRFLGGGQYESDHAGASGVVGNQQFSRQVYKGLVQLEPWSMTLTNRFRGESETYTCHFEAVKGGKILVLRDRRDTVLFLGKKG